MNRFRHPRAQGFLSSRQRENPGTRLRFSATSLRQERQRRKSLGMRLPFSGPQCQFIVMLFGRGMV